MRTACSQSVVHERWSFASGQNDVALCFLSQAVADIDPIALAQGAPATLCALWPS